MKQRVNITIDESIYKKLSKRADNNYRSISGEISAILNDVLTGVLVPATQLPQIISQPFTQPIQPQQLDPITNPPYKITLDKPDTHDTTDSTTTPDILATTHTKHKDIPERWMRLQRHRPKG